MGHRNEPRPNRADLTDLLNEARILLPGCEVLVAFLISLPFTARFESLTPLQRSVYFATFASALAALVCFLTPAAYHRLARPIRARQKFKIFATRLLIVGVVPLSFSLVLASYLVTSIAFSTPIAIAFAAAAALFIGTMWWLLPLLRLHSKQAQPPEHREPAHGRPHRALRGHYVRRATLRRAASSA